MVQLLVSGVLLVVAIAVKLLMPDVLDRYRARVLDLLGADTDFVEVFSAAGRAFSEEGAIGFAYTAPVEGQLSSGFGLRTDPLEGVSRFHYGLDIAAPEGAVVSSFADGTVTAVGESSELGRYVAVSHANGFSTLYAHCTRVTASAGQQVSRGDPIAEVGDTGRATGPHLHFELHHGSTYLNPVYYVTFS